MDPERSATDSQPRCDLCGTPTGALIRLRPAPEAAEMLCCLACAAALRKGRVPGEGPALASDDPGPAAGPREIEA